MIDGVPMHFPIFFIDPYLESVKGLMGFDMMSARTMREPLLASLASGEPTASKPYKLREGGRGYVLIKALDTFENFSTKGSVYSEGGLAVLLMIKTDTMLASAAEIVPGARVRLLYGKDRMLAAEDIPPKIASLPIITTNTFMEERDFDDLGQPFTLSIEQSAGLYARHLYIMGLIFTLMCLSYGVYYTSLIAKYRLQLQRDAALIELSKQHANLEVMVAERTKELQRKSDENTSLAQQLIRVQEDQIHHIARELHDEFGQTLTAIKINAHILEGAENIQEVATYAKDITSQADALYETMRNMIQRLRPEALDMFGLKVAVEQCILAFHLDEQEIELDLNIDDSVNDVEEIYTIASYRIVQELVNNAVKHAKLTALEVRLYVSDQNMHIVVEDNGIGFDPLKHKLGFGLSGVDERARSLGGIVDISTVIDEGVKVYVSIPLQAS
jgi:signal transduction histidine kinase